MEEGISSEDNYWGLPKGQQPAPPPPPPPPPPRFPCDHYGPGLGGYACHAGHCSTGGVPTAPPNCGMSLAEPAIDCDPAAAPATCAAAAARACDAMGAQCRGFGLCPDWMGERRAKLFATGNTTLVANSDWTLWTKA